MNIGQKFAALSATIARIAAAVGIKINAEGEAEPAAEGEKTLEQRVADLEAQVKDHEERLEALETDAPAEDPPAKEDEPAAEGEDNPEKDEEEDKEAKAKVLEFDKAVAAAVQRQMASIGVTEPIVQPPAGGGSVASSSLGKDLIAEFEAIKDPKVKASFMRKHQKAISEAIRNLR